LAVGAGVVTVGTLVGVPPVVSGCATATTGAPVGTAVGTDVVVGEVGLSDGSTDRVGATVGVGVGPLDGGGLTVGAGVGWAAPGTDDGG